MLEIIPSSRIRSRLMAAPASKPAAVVPVFRAPYAEDDGAIAARLLAGTRREPAAKARIDARATDLIDAIRTRKVGFGGIEELLREYSLSTKEGLALMVLAEALLRVPDAATADQLIEDKLGQGDFANHESKSDAFLVSASAWALGITARVIQPGETPTGIIGGLAKRLGVPTVRTATRQAMRVMGNHFVLGQTIEEALKRAGSKTGKLYRYSFDMLGEGARTQADADRYLASYAAAIDAIGRSAGNEPLPNRPGISVKLSALHPRYDATNHERVLSELVPKVIALARQAKGYDLNFTIDAEEADRLELSLDVIDAVLTDASLAGWDGFGLAIQAYQKRASAVIDHIAALAEANDRRMMVRLVKGAYWDTELKRAQERGLADYPVFTRKAMTDLNYEVCAAQMLALRPRIIPQFATHNALTVATVAEMAGNAEGFEFQRLHGMGEALYERLLADKAGYACRTYAPVGGHQDLLAYLVRRLLENGANSSFVSVSGDPDVPVASLLVPPADIIGNSGAARHRRIPLPADLYGPSRKNSAGVELGHEESLQALLNEIAAASAKPFPAASAIIDGKSEGGAPRPVLSPIDGKAIGTVAEADAALADRAMRAAKAGFAGWSETPARTRAAALRKAADLMEDRRGLLLALLQAEAGKTLDDAISEVREAVDFCRYYAAEAEAKFATPSILPGPTGEENRLVLRGRGAFLCIAPWNFPLAIFAGQIAAALVAGNSVVAKPAPQTPLIAAVAVRLLHEAGVPVSALHLMPGDGAVGGALVAHPAVAGVAFTGSTATARGHQPRACRQGWPDRAVDRRDRRPQRHDRRCHGAGRAGRRRRRDVGLPLGRPALLGAAPARRAGRRRRQDDRDDHRRHARACARRPPRDRHPYRPGDRCRRQEAPRRSCRRDAQARSRHLGGHGARSRRHLCRAACDCAEECRGAQPGAFWADPACRALEVRRARQGHRRDRCDRLWPDARRALTHRDHGRAGHRKALDRQYLRQPQHHRCGCRGATLRWPRAVRYRAEGRRPALPDALCHRADRDDQHRRRRRQCQPDRDGGVRGGDSQPLAVRNNTSVIPGDRRETRDPFRNICRRGSGMDPGSALRSARDDGA
jgi:RHH-type proline utilization regulon transcriptional repressor/proline dehydrogenase/delta 1-pyrroline-5-carboxylate dehydrogenase